MPEPPAADDAPTPRRSARLIGELERAAQLLREGHEVQLVGALIVGGARPRAVVHVTHHERAHDLVWRLLHEIQRLEPGGPISEVSEVEEDDDA